jgi:hypothetical protein
MIGRNDISDGWVKVDTPPSGLRLRADQQRPGSSSSSSHLRESTADALADAGDLFKEYMLKLLCMDRGPGGRGVRG